MRFAPSLASAPLDRLSEVIRELDRASVDLIHFDVEDGVFVPVMTLGMKIIRDLRPLTDIPFDVHLMMVNPEWLIPQLVVDGANRITVHWEACPYPRRILSLIVEQGAQAGVAFNPATPIPDLSYLKPLVSIVNVLTSEPEAGSPFLPGMLDKLQRARERLPDAEWIVDGGVTTDNVQAVARAGADTAVVGRFFFAGDSPSSLLDRLHRASVG